MPSRCRTVHYFNPEPYKEWLVMNLLLQDNMLGDQDLFQSRNGGVISPVKSSTMDRATDRESKRSRTNYLATVWMESMDHGEREEGIDIRNNNHGACIQIHDVIRSLAPLRARPRGLETGKNCYRTEDEGH